jgi:hypothetical protein
LIFIIHIQKALGESVRKGCHRKQKRVDLKCRKSCEGFENQASTRVRLLFPITWPKLIAEKRESTSFVSVADSQMSARAKNLPVRIMQRTEAVQPDAAAGRSNKAR